MPVFLQPAIRPVLVPAMPPVSVVVRKVCEVVRLARSSVVSIWMSLRLSDASTLLVLILPVFVQWRMMPSLRPAMPPVAHQIRQAFVGGGFCQLRVLRAVFRK